MKIGFAFDKRFEPDGASPFSLLYKKTPLRGLFNLGGERGIRTPDTLLTYASFQDWCIQPLCHLSNIGYRCISPMNQGA